MKKNKGCIGLAIGCGVLIILGIALLVSLGIWLNQKQEFDQTKTILNNEVDYYVQLKLGKEEKAIVEFFQELSNRSNRNNPMFKKFPILEGLTKKDAERDLKKLLPLRIEVQGMPQLDEFQVSVGFSLYNRIASIIYYFMEKGAKDKGHLYSIDQKDYILFEDDKQEPVFISLFENTFYLANQQPGIEAMLKNRPVGQEIHHESEGLNGVDVSRPFYGYVTRSAIQQKTFEFFGLENFADWTWMTPDVVSRVAWDLDVGQDRKTLNGRVILELPDAAQSELVGEKLEELKAKIEALKHVEVHMSWDQNEIGFVVYFEISNLEFPNGANGIIKIKHSKDEADRTN